ncbi:MAG: ATP-binding protein [Rikenellaceae bacterium]
MKLNLKHKPSNFYRRALIVALAVFLVGVSLYYTSQMAHELRLKENNEVAVWSHAMERLGVEFNRQDRLVHQIISNHNTIPFIVTNTKLEVIESHLIDEKILKHPDLLRNKMDEFSSENQPLRISSWDGMDYFIFFGQSSLLKKLRFFPAIQLLTIAIFIFFLVVSLHSAKSNEQNRVWVGLAKETAHQLGTPTSSLLGWIEYLKSLDIDQNAVDEMSKDLTRLTKVVDRFSKIGSETILSPVNVNELVGSTVQYFKTRIPRNVTLHYNGLAIAPTKAMINEALFEWVIENLLKNSLDALQGKGVINVTISSDKKYIHIDVQDTGKGIAKANFKRIFDPGFTTKTRGWGLGLSLSKRIVSEYHNGSIAVTESEIGKGTTIRISLNKV